MKNRTSLIRNTPKTDLIVNLGNPQTPFAKLPRAFIFATMSIMPETIHIVHESPKYSFYVLLLLIPAMVFVFVLTIILGNSPQKFAASTTGTSVLGSEIESNQ